MSSEYCSCTVKYPQRHSGPRAPTERTVNIVSTPVKQMLRFHLMNLIIELDVKYNAIIILHIKTKQIAQCYE